MSGRGLRQTIHGREHCAGGEDPIPCLVRPWFRQTLDFSSLVTPLSVPVDTEVTLQWDGEVFGDGGEGFFESRTGPDRFGCLVAGHIEMRGEVLWDDTFDSWAEIQMHDGGLNPCKQTAWMKSPQSEPTQTFYWTQRFNTGSIEFKVCHGDTVDRSVVAAYMEFVWLGGYTGSNPFSIPPEF